MSFNFRVLRIPAVTGTTGLSRSTIYRLIKEGLFPKPVKLGLAAVGWRASDIETWLSSRPTAGAV